MKSIIRLLAVPLLTASFPAAAQRVDADLQCKRSGTDFAYDCTLFLTRSGEPLSDAQVTVGADMPSMPMAHNVKPVKAQPGHRPGEYLFRLDLEMQGQWVVKLRLSHPIRDQLNVHYNFDDEGATAAPRKRGEVRSSQPR